MHTLCEWNKNISRHIYFWYRICIPTKARGIAHNKKLSVVLQLHIPSECWRKLMDIQFCSMCKTGMDNLPAIDIRCEIWSTLTIIQIERISSNNSHSWSRTKHKTQLQLVWLVHIKVGIFTSYERNNGVGRYHIDNIINDILPRSVKEWEYCDSLKHKF